MSSPRRALLVIDVQNEYFSGQLRIAHPPVAESLPNIVRAMAAAHAQGVPVVVFQHTAPEQSPVFARAAPPGRCTPRSRRSRATTTCSRPSRACSPAPAWPLGWRRARSIP